MKITRKISPTEKLFHTFQIFSLKNIIYARLFSALSATSRQSNGRRWSKFENLFRHTILIIIRTWKFFLRYEKWKFLFFIIIIFPPLYSGNAKHFELAHTLWHDSLTAADGDHADGSGGQRFIFRLLRFVNLFFVLFFFFLL